MTIRRGESYPIYISLKQDGVILTPDMIAGLKVCLGDLHKTYGSGVGFDEQTMQWWIHPTQAETLAMQKGQSEVCAHVKYHNGSLYIVDLGKVNVKSGCCEEVF